MFFWALEEGGGEEEGAEGHGGAGRREGRGRRGLERGYTQTGKAVMSPFEGRWRQSDIYFLASQCFYHVHLPVNSE